MNYNLSDFIHVEYNTLSEEFCNGVIGKFETDSRKRQGRLGSGKNSVVNVDIKDSVDLMISGLDDWKEEDEVLFNSVNKCSQKYRNKNLLEDIKIPILLDTMSDTGYQIQKTSPNSGYTWHDDFDPSYDNTSVASGSVAIQVNAKGVLPGTVTPAFVPVIVGALFDNVVVTAQVPPELVTKAPISPNDTP